LKRSRCVPGSPHDFEQISGLHHRGAPRPQQPQIILALINAS
jgi:hypothetical protein